MIKGDPIGNLFSKMPPEWHDRWIEYSVSSIVELCDHDDEPGTIRLLKGKSYQKTWYGRTRNRRWHILTLSVDGKKLLANGKTIHNIDKALSDYQKKKNKEDRKRIKAESIEKYGTSFMQELKRI